MKSIQSISFRGRVKIWVFSLVSSRFEGNLFLSWWINWEYMPFFDLKTSSFFRFWCIFEAILWIFVSDRTYLFIFSTSEHYSIKPLPLYPYSTPLRFYSSTHCRNIKSFPPYTFFLFFSFVLDLINPILLLEYS